MLPIGPLDQELALLRITSNARGLGRRADPPRRNLKGIPVRAVHIGTPHIETVASWLLWGAGGRD